MKQQKHLNIDDDISLINEIKKGNQKSFEELFNKYYNLLSNYSDNIINDKSTAEEVVADVFANIWIKRKKLNINKNVKSYLYKSTRNTTISYLRKQKDNIEIIDENQINIPNYWSSPDNKLLKEDLNFKLENMLCKIPERSREIFTLHRFNGLKYNDIAQILDISVKTVEKHMSKSLKIIRENYKKYLNN